MTKRKSVVDSVSESVAKTIEEEDTLDLKNDTQYLKARAALFIGKFSKDVLNERLRQIEKFGDKSHLPHKGPMGDVNLSEHEAKALCQLAFKVHRGTWFHIHFEEFCEAYNSEDTVHLRGELVQLIATLTAHVQAIDEGAAWRLEK